jgi:YndJ-like protein
MYALFPTPNLYCLHFLQFMPMINFKNIAAAGVLCWFLLLLYVQPDARHDDWARMILLLAVLVWTPLALRLLQYPERYAGWVGAAGLALTVVLFLPAGPGPGLVSCGWLLVAFWVFKTGVDQWIRQDAPPGASALSAGQVFLAVGGIWTSFDRFGWQPLGFDPAIVLLTGVHFHYAGFIFPLLTGWLQAFYPGKTARWSAHLAIAAVPMTAIGITVAQLYQAFLPETLAAAVVAVSGWLCGYCYLRYSFVSKDISKTARLAGVIVGLSLFFSMTLALGYAIRPYFPLAWLQIPAMRAWHGTVNALGVAGAGLAVQYLRRI